MGIEKITGSSSMSYQGSAAINTTPASNAVEQSTGAPEMTMNTASPMQDFSLDKGMENAQQNEELMGAQSNQLKDAVNELNKQMTNSEAIFGIHEKTNRVTIKIVDKETKKVLKEYPPEQTLDMIAKVWEIAGILVDEKR